MIMQVQAYQVADSIDIKSVRSAFRGELYHSDSDELLYRMGDSQLLYVFKYGVVCLLNYNAAAATGVLQAISPHGKNPHAEPLVDDFIIETDAAENKIGNNKIEVVRTDMDVLRLVMLNVSQSVALDYFEDQASRLLRETNRHTKHLEQKGRLFISGRKLQQYIAHTLMLRNNIVENLYIFDSPPETWEDEGLSRVDLGMRKVFDLQERFRNISESLAIVKDNLELFRDILKYRHSNTLEWIVIILIAVEVVNMVLEKLRGA
ncbi:MAG: RMD1 family protein [Chitinophagaceae bacterium]|nr:MAG: RMD1 family protein [Chitinophagaceae bacterium]